LKLDTSLSEVLVDLRQIAGGSLEGVAAPGLSFQRSKNHHLQRAGKAVWPFVLAHNLAGRLSSYTCRY